MAKDLSRYQQGIVRRYYENRDSIAINKLAETVSDLYVETSKRKIDTAWRNAFKHMQAAGIHEHQAQAIVDDRDLGALAKVVQALT